MRLVFLMTPGPGGGGGGGGLVQKAPPPKARSARDTSGSQVHCPSAVSRSRLFRCRNRRSRLRPRPARGGDAAGGHGADHYRRRPTREIEVGVWQDTAAENDSHGPGKGGGAGSGTGTGLGEGDGSGVGPGSGGGTGGGPYRPGSGIEPPRLLREVRADYTAMRSAARTQRRGRARNRGAPRRQRSAISRSCAVLPAA